MVEDIGTVIRKGFSTWTKNLNLCIPFIFEMLTAIIFFVLALLFFTLVFIVPVVSQQNIDPATLTQNDLFNILGAIFSENIWLLALFGLIIILVYTLVQSFFAAGAIGMAREALEKGHTTVSKMFHVGKENFINLFLTNILVFLIAFAGLVLLIPGILTVGDLDVFLSDPENALASASLLLAGMFVWAVYIIFLSIIFLLVDYALVIEGLDPITAIEKGVSFVMANKFSSVIVWFLVVGISVFLNLAGEAASYVDVVSQIWSFGEFILSIIVIQPLITVWLTRFYLDRTDRKLYSFEDYLLEE